MSQIVEPPAPAATPPRPHRKRTRSTLVARGEPMLWLAGGALVACVLMILGFIGWIAYQGFPSFWPQAIVQVETLDGRGFMGEVAREQDFVLEASMTQSLGDDLQGAADAVVLAGGEEHRRLLRTGNYQLFGTHFNWVSDFEVAEESKPDWALVVERLEWGRFYGFPEACAFLTPLEGDEQARRTTAGELLAGSEPGAGAVARVLVDRRIDGDLLRRFVALDELQDGDRVQAVAEVWEGHEAAWARFQARHGEVRELWAETRRLRRVDIGEVNHRLEKSRLMLRRGELDYQPSPAWMTAYQDLVRMHAGGSEGQIQKAEARLAVIEADFGRPVDGFLAVVAAVEKATAQAEQDFAAITDRIEALEVEMNRDQLLCSTVQPGREAMLGLGEIVRAYPANQVGFGQASGIYLSRWWEYLSDEPREANSEGGVFPAIFGTVLMTLIMCLLVVPFGVLAALYLREYAKAGPIITLVRIAVNNLAGVPSIVFGVFGLGFFCYIVGAGIDELLFAERLPQPTFGTGGLMWASFTLALMTAPVVIVATEEALSAVPNSMREGSYACGASKWQTIRRIVLPRAMPGIMTGAILAMARGAGEVAPLMLVGAVKLAPELPIDTEFPFGVNRSFMHLGFHIYDLGFQSQNSEAAQPMVYTTTLILILIIASLNVGAIWMRTRLQRRFVGSHF